MSWLRIFEGYRKLEADKVDAEARARFLQDQVETLQSQVEMLDGRAQEALTKLLADREAVSDMFASRVMGEGVFDPNRQPPAPKPPKTAEESAAAAGPRRIPAYMVAREMTKRAFQEDAARVLQEAQRLQEEAEQKLGIKLSYPAGEGDPPDAASVG